MFSRGLSWPRGEPILSRRKCRLRGEEEGKCQINNEVGPRGAAVEAEEVTRGGRAGGRSPPWFTRPRRVSAALTGFKSG